MKHGTPHYGGGPAAAWAARAGTLPWKWQLHRCADGHQHWTDPLGATHVVSPTAPLGVPRPDAHELSFPAPSLITALDYAMRTCQVRPARQALPHPQALGIQRITDLDDPPPF